MKLIFCPICHDVVRLVSHERACICGKSWGQYINQIDAIIGGEATPIGFNNASFADALGNQPPSGLGERFEAFVIPEVCDTIEITEKRNSRKIFAANFWGEVMVFSAVSKQAVIDFVTDNKIVTGIGPMDLSDRIWEIPGYQKYTEDVSIICVGKSHLGDK